MTEFTRVWDKIAIIEEEEGNPNMLAVQVSQSNDRKTRYTLQFGRSTERGFVTYVPVTVTGTGKVSIKSIAERIAALASKAESHIEEQAQVHEDAVMEVKIAREKSQLDRGLPKLMPGLKKLGKIHK